LTSDSDGQPGVGVQIDKARTDHLLRRINHPGRFKLIRVPAMNRHTFIFDENGGAEARASTAVDNHPIFDD
jgi:hypothetical protein